nr:3-hydroxyisobutyrate dehydrogenase [Gautieria morchelliformis]
MRGSIRCLQSLGRHIPRRQTVGFIGLGQMGHAMAANWVSNRIDEISASPGDSHVAFVVCDVDHARAASFANTFGDTNPRAQISVAATPADVALASETLLTMLPASPQVRDAYQGPSGILSALRSLPKDVAASTLCIDSTTLDVEVAKEVAVQVKALGADMVDAPVSGGVPGAKAATLSFLVGGTTGEFERVSPFLSFMGRRIIHCGASGAGLVAKICNNLILGVEQIVVAEAMLLGQKLGVDPAVLAGVINSSTGACWASSVNNPVPGSVPDKALPCERDYEGGFVTALMLKDMGLATHMGSSVGSPLPLAKSAEHIYAGVIQRHKEFATKDFSSVYKYLEGAAQEGREVTTQ